MNIDFLQEPHFEPSCIQVCVLHPQSLRRKVRGRQQKPHECMKKCENALGTQEQQDGL